ncbi:Fe-S cluster assembly ATPase SufC [Candidatus Gracilibacteria bacterium]|nr:Fe-S cluster assembly ATPase SufC [Candidatus Gracilibacteria bacterium]
MSKLLMFKNDSSNMLEIKNLQISASQKQILHGISMCFETGKNYCLLGKNGSGKSSLSGFLMGNPNYTHISGEVTIDTKNLIQMDPEERSKNGLFLSFQHIPEIPGIQLSEYLRTIYNISLKNKNPAGADISPFIFKRHIQKYLDELHIDASFLERDLNVGFSGGEKRKIEMLQMKLIEPSYIILDEIDSGLDLDAFRSMAALLQSMSSPQNTFIIITHQFKILDYIHTDYVYVLRDGEVVKEGGREVIDEVKEKGFKEI